MDGIISHEQVMKHIKENKNNNYIFVVPTTNIKNDFCTHNRSNLSIKLYITFFII